MGNWEANDKLLETVEVKYQELRDAMGNRYASVMEHEAVLLANASMAMAARMRLFRDTVVDIAGGDLLDLIEEDDDEQSP